MAELCRDAAFRRRWFAKSELLGVLADAFDGDEVDAFEQIRAAAKSGGMLGAIAVRCEGERRGTRYAFGVAEQDDAPLEGDIEVYQGDNLEILRALPDGAFDLIYIDPPFNHGPTAISHAHQDRARRRGGSRRVSRKTLSHDRGRRELVRG